MVGSVVICLVCVCVLNRLVIIFLNITFFINIISLETRYRHFPPSSIRMRRVNESQDEPYGSPLE